MFSQWVNVTKENNRILRKPFKMQNTFTDLRMKRERDAELN